MFPAARYDIDKRNLWSIKERAVLERSWLSDGKSNDAVGEENL